MFSSTKIRLLVLLIVFVQLVSEAQSQEKCIAAPSKISLEEILGKPVEGPTGPEGRVWFRKSERSVTVKFSSFDSAENLIISYGDGGIEGLTELLNQLVPKSSRGKFLRRGPGKSFRQNWQIYTEEYECLTIEFSQQYAPLNSMPAVIEVKWKGPSNNRAGQQSLAADGATACFSSNLFQSARVADRAPQLKASVMPPQSHG